MKAYKEEKRKIKRCVHQSKKEVNEQLGWVVSQDSNRNGEFFWKEVRKRNGGKEEKMQQNKGYKWEVGTGRG